jgi:hypothetical protein
VVHFVVAGQTAPGTAAAGHFLAFEWKKIHKLYKANRRELGKHSIAVLLKHSTTRGSEEECDRTGKIASRATWATALK